MGLPAGEQLEKGMGEVRQGQQLQGRGAAHIGFSPSLGMSVKSIISLYLGS